MPLTIEKFKEKYPVYKNWPDKHLAEQSYKKFYADKLPKPDFMRQVLSRETIIGKEAVDRDVPPEKETILGGLISDAKQSVQNLIPKQMPSLLPSEFREDVPVEELNLKARQQESESGLTGFIYPPIEKRKRQFTKEGAEFIMGTLEKAFLPFTAPITVGANVLQGLIRDIKGKGSKGNIDAIGRIIALNPKPGDQIFVADLLKEVGVTDTSASLPEGTIDRIGFIADWPLFGGVAKLQKMLANTLTSKFPAKTFNNEIKIILEDSIGKAPKTPEEGVLKTKFIEPILESIKKKETLLKKPIETELAKPKLKTAALRENVIPEEGKGTGEVAEAQSTKLLKNIIKEEGKGTGKKFEPTLEKEAIVPRETIEAPVVSKEPWQMTSKEYYGEEKQIKIYEESKVDPAELPWTGDISAGRDYLSNVSGEGKLSGVKIVDVKDIQATEKTSKEQVDNLKGYIKDANNDLPPIIVERDADGLFVVDGHNRFQAAKELGYTKIPVKEYELPADVSHEQIVKQALSEGKPVPPEVLKDYPELQKDYALGKPVPRETALRETIGEISRSINPPGFSPEQQVGIKIPAIAQEGEIPKVIISKSDIIKFMSEKLDIPIRIGKMRQGKSTLGIFKVKPEVIRTRLANDVPVAAHELGHFLEKSLFGTTKLKGHGLTGKAFVQFQDELSGIATPANAASSVESEGFAEFISRFIVSREEAKKIAPKFYKWFIDDILENKHPETKEILIQLSDDFNGWMKQSSVAKVMAQISFGEGGSFNLPSFSKIYTAAKEKFYPIQLAVENLNPDIAVNENPFILTRLYADWTGTAEQFLRYGQISTKKFEVGQKIGPSLEEIYAPIRTKHREFSAYRVARRSIELAKRGKKTGISIEDAEQAFKELHSPEFDKAFVEIQKLMDNVMQQLVDAGFFTKKTFEYFKSLNRDYAPFYRVVETETTGTGKGISSVFNPVKKLTKEGSTRQIIDPAESDVKNIYTYTAIAKKQEIMNALVNLSKLDKSGKYIEKVPKDIIPIKISNDELYRIFENFAVWTERTEFKEFKNSFSKTTGIKDGKVSQPIQKLESIIIDALKKRGMTEGEGRAFISRLKAAKGAEEVDKVVETIIEKQTILHTVKEMELNIPNWVSIFRPAQGVPKGNFIQHFKNGKSTLYQLDPELHAAVTGLDGLDLESVNMLIKFLAIPARALRAGATLTPEFSFKNIMRDPFPSFVYSKSGFVFGVDTIKGFFHALKQDKWYQAYRVGGAGHSMLVSMDRTMLQTNFKELLNEITVTGHVKNIVRHPIETLRIMSELFETSSRLGNFTKTYKHFTTLSEQAIKLAETAPKTLDKSKPFVKLKVLGKTKKVENTQKSLQEISQQFLRERMPASAFEGREIPQDFHRIGSKMQAMNQITAFFNARLEGYDRMAKAFIDRPFVATAKAFTSITLPSILLWWANKDDPRYQELPRWEKMVFWHILTDKHIWRIPKPFELGFVFGTIPENIMDWLYRKDPEGLKNLFKGIRKDFLNTIIPTAPRPIIENWANKSLFLDRPLVPRDLEQLQPKYQSRPWTSETTKLVGNILNYSPAKIQNIVQGYTGGLGRLALEVTDRAVLQFIDEPIQPSPALSDIPIIRSFASRWPTSGAESIEKFYLQYGRAKQTYDTYIRLEKSGISEKEMQKFQDSNKKDLVMYALNKPIFDSIVETMSTGHKLITLIYNNRTLSSEDKRKAIDRLYLHIINETRKGNKLIKKGGKYEKNN